ncbi:oxidoreductase ucpA [Lojkania enalia]|uniref:Oxidoreductase ucpA n=1 Tax=Lojkania enalia TaxID=147567 RepID=A0A9P4K5B0_9PLEO|nr:oxidoreductase ucpA [Didymosphaeria enalia]
MAFALRGVAYITGAGSGIGQYAAYSLARQGVRSFALLDRNPVTKTASELKKTYADISIKEIEIDVANEAAVNDSIAQAVKEFGRIDYALNNAGIGGMLATTDQIPRDDFERVLAVNATGVWLCQRAQIRQMLQQEKLSNTIRSYRGSIVNVASMYGVIGPTLNVPSTAYSTSKHAVVGLTRADGVAFAPKGIKINAICPGYVLTPLVQDTMDKEGSAGGNIMDIERRKVPLERFARMDEIGDAISYLLSDASSYMIGAAMVVDGGFSIQ